jgi:hypothetical protein
MLIDIYSVYRILGSITKKEGKLLREAYDNGRYGRKLETALQKRLKKGHFQSYCLNIIAGDKFVDTTNTPLVGEYVRWRCTCIVYLFGLWHEWVVGQREGGMGRPRRDCPRWGPVYANDSSRIYC